MVAPPHPVVLDTTVLSNFASSESVDWLVAMLDQPTTVPAVRTELERGREHGHGFLDAALDRIGSDIAILAVNSPAAIDAASSIRDRLDAGEADALVAAIDHDGALATDDLAARSAAARVDVPVTGSVGLLVLGIRRDMLTVDTANEWLTRWRAERGYYAPVDRIEDIVDDGEE